MARGNSKRADPARGAVSDMPAAAFYDLVVAPAYGGVRSMLRDPSRIEEVTHDVLLELWNSRVLPSGGHHSTATAVTTLARRRAAERDRRDDPCPPTSSGSQGTGVRDDLDDALDALPNEIRELIVLAQVAGLTHREIARVVDEPEGIVATRVRAGLATLGQSGRRPVQSSAATRG